MACLLSHQTTDSGLLCKVYNVGRDLFDYVIWVDRSEHLPPETGSMDITRETARPDFTIDNNGTLEELEKSIDDLVVHIL